MKILIVFAHPEQHSFNGALKYIAFDTLTKEGHEIQISDLYEMNFNPIAGEHDFTQRKNPEYLSIQKEQRFAYQTCHPHDENKKAKMMGAIQNAGEIGLNVHSVAGACILHGVRNRYYGSNCAIF